MGAQVTGTVLEHDPQLIRQFNLGVIVYPSESQDQGVACYRPASNHKKSKAEAIERIPLCSYVESLYVGFVATNQSAITGTKIKKRAEKFSSFYLSTGYPQL